MSIPIPARPTFAPSPPVRTTSSSFSSPLPQSASSSSTPSAAPPPPPSPSPFILSGDTNVEYATLPLPDHCIIRWRSFKPVQSSTGAPIPPPLPQAPPAQPDNDQPPPPQPQASTSSSRPSSSSTWTQAGVQAIETARRSLMTSARAHRPARPDGRPPFNLADSLLAIATPSNSPPSTDKPVDIQHPSPASIDGGNGVTEEVCAAELWVFAISSDELDHDDDDDQEEGQLQAGHGLFRALNGLHWENLQESSSGYFSPSAIYPSPSDASSKSAAPGGNLSPLKPHGHLLPAYPTFLRAAKEAILEEMAAADDGAIRHGDGIVLAPSQASGRSADEEGARKGDEWGDCWKVSGHRTSLLLTFTLTVLPTLILLTPRARRIPVYPYPTQPSSSSPPPIMGAHVVLLPLATKAVFVRTSSSPVSDARSAEEQTFWDGLDGRGVRADQRREERDWVVCWVPASSTASKKAPTGGPVPEDHARPHQIGGREKEKAAAGVAASVAATEDGSSAGTLVCWPASLVLIDSATADNAIKPAQSPHINKSATSHLPQSHKSRTLAPLPKPSPAAFALGSSHLPALWSSLTSSSSRLSTFPATPNASNPASTDGVDEIALASGVYLETLVREREREKERAEEERERERRKKEMDDLASTMDVGQGSAVGASGYEDGAIEDGSHAMGSPHGSDLWGSPSPSAEHDQPSQDVAVPQPSTAHADPIPTVDMMDWDWTNSGFDMGSLGLDRTDDNAWDTGEVDEDDFDFFNSAPLMVDPPFVATAADLGGDSQPSVDADQLQLLASLGHDPSFSLSPLPTDLPAPPSTGPQHAGQFSPSLDVDMTSFSPSMIFPQSTTPVPHHASPGSGSLHVPASPASWAHQGRTPKTPKTPFSPFVEIDEDLLEEDELSDGELDGRAESVVPARAPSTVGAYRTALAAPGYEPINFGRSHAIADAKYERGKFALPSPASPRSMVLYEPRRKGWRNAIAAQQDDLQVSAKRRKVEQVSSLLAPWTQKVRPIFPPLLFHSLHQPSTEHDAPHLRLLYDQLSNPKIGIIRRLQESSSLKRKRAAKADLARLPTEFGRRLRIGGSSSVFDRRRDEDGERSDEEDADREEGQGTEWSAGGNRGFYPTRNNGSSIPTILGLDVKADNDHVRVESEPSVGLNLLSASFLGVYPTLPPSTIPLPHPYCPSAHPTPTPSAAPTPAPASALTPAWAPTPTSPPVGSSAKETTTADIEQLADWLAKEAVENPQVRNELRICAFKRHGEGEESGPALPVDTQLVRASLKTIDDAHSTSARSLLSLADLSASAALNSAASVESLSPPLFAIGHQAAVIKIAPTAVRFWDRIGLEPVGGKKDVVAFALFEPSASNVNAKVASLLGRLGSAYETRGLGKHLAGSASTFKGGAVPFGQVELSDALNSIISDLPTPTPHLVFYLVAPLALKSSAFSLRDIQSQLASFTSRLLSTSTHFIFHTVSLSQVLEDESSPSSSRAALDRTALAMYDRLPRHVDRLIPRRMFPEDLSPSNTSSAIAHPAFHIARPKEKPVEVKFTLSWPPPTLNLVDRHMFLHVAYAVSASGEWLVAMVVDERGQSQETKVWRLETRYSHDRLVSRVWEFATTFAKTADVEWRMVVCKLGLMGWDEIAAWDVLLSHAIPLFARPLHVFLACTNSSSTAPFLISASSLAPSTPTHSRPHPTPSPASSFYLDVSHLALALFPSHRTPYAIPHSTHPTSPSAFAHPSAPKELQPPPVPTGIDEVLPLSSFTILHTPANPTLATAHNSAGGAITSLSVHHLMEWASPTSSALPEGELRRDLARSFHALDVLGRERSGRGGGGMPLHLRGVETMREVVDGVREGAFGL